MSFLHILAIVYYSSSGAFSASKCPPSKDPVPYSAESWDPNDVGKKNLAWEIFLYVNVCMCMCVRMY
jgi:hypothetical protein